mmetsp:Transcript_12368/g.33997  ORF Transcript_12368/g.33997 Transcript_12368/m.33997 type:complete len:265 (+) Transcript_12368:293-1087(+)
MAFGARELRNQRRHLLEVRSQLPQLRAVCEFYQLEPRPPWQFSVRPVGAVRPRAAPPRRWHPRLLACSRPLAFFPGLPPDAVAKGGQLTGPHLSLIISDGDDVRDALGVAAGAPGKSSANPSLHLVSHAVKVLYLVQSEGHSVPLHERKLVAIWDPRQVTRGSQLDLLRIEHPDWRAGHAMTMDVLGEQWEIFLDCHVHPSGQGVCDNAHNSKLLRLPNHVDRLLLQVLHLFDKILVVRELVPEPLRDHVTPIFHGLHCLGVPL